MKTVRAAGPVAKTQSRGAATRGRWPMIAGLALVATGLPAQASIAAPVQKARAARASDEAATAAVAAALREQAGGAMKRFYAERGFRPLWARNGSFGRPAALLIDHLETADADGLDPRAYRLDRLRAALTQAQGGDPQAVARAELMLSTAFARYVQDQRKSRTRMIWADRRLKPKKLRAETVLRAAAFPEDFTRYVGEMGWMSPRYVELREAAAKSGGALDDAARARLRVNLDRARLLPGPWTRHVEVDASSARLWYYEAGRQVGTMRVVVGARETQTPMLVGSLQWAILNPYWNVPDYLAEGSIARKVLAGRSLAAMRMEALSDWSANARTLEPSEIDWNAVAAGKQLVRIRQLPGPANSMGRVKFLFPNDEGIYLHDTPDRDLLRKDVRQLSNGCIRLEDAPALGRWLMQTPLKAAGKAPEQAVALPVQVPVYLTYLTAAPAKTGVAFRDDVYGRDG